MQPRQPLEAGGGGVRREARGQGVDLLRVQHLPGSGARPRGDAMWSSVLLAVHLQVRHTTVASPSPSPDATSSPTSPSDPDSSRVPLSPPRRWLRVFPDAQQCPVCKAALSEDLVIPLYGRGTCGGDPRPKHMGEDVPLRPPGIRLPVQSVHLGEGWDGQDRVGGFVSSVLGFGFQFGAGVRTSLLGEIPSPSSSSSTRSCRGFSSSSGRSSSSVSSSSEPAATAAPRSSDSKRRVRSRGDGNPARLYFIPLYCRIPAASPPPPRRAAWRAVFTYYEIGFFSSPL